MSERRWEDLSSEEMARVLAEQADGDAHDRGLIVESLGWTPEQRFDANVAYIRFYLSIRPEGPLIQE